MIAALSNIFNVLLIIAFERARSEGFLLVIVLPRGRPVALRYWTSDEKLLEGMLRPAPADQGTLAGQTGGVVWVKLRR